MSKATQRYVIARSPNAGIGDHLSCLLGAWYYAKKTKRTLIIDWRGSRFNLDAPSDANCFEYWFHPLTKIEEVPVVGDNGVGSIVWSQDVWPNKWTPDALAAREFLQHTSTEIAETQELIASGRDLPQKFVVFDSWLKPWPPLQDRRDFFSSLQFSETIRASVNAFKEKHSLNIAPIAIHIRHGNGENLGHRAAYWLTPVSLIRQLNRNKNNDIHSRKLSGPFYDNMPESLIGGAEQGRQERCLLERVASAVHALRQRTEAVSARPLLFTDAPHIFEEMSRFLPDLLSAETKHRPKNQGALHQVASVSAIGDGALITEAVPNTVAEDMMFELALMRSCSALVCLESGFTAITRTELGPEKVISLRPSLLNRMICRLHDRLLTTAAS